MAINRAIPLEFCYIDIGLGMKKHTCMFEYVAARGRTMMIVAKDITALREQNSFDAFHVFAGQQ
jgi:hypothetical protein